MLTVTQNNQTEMLNQLKGFEMDEEVNGSFTVKFASFSVENNPGHELTKEESVVSVDGYDFRVKQLRENRSRKEVTSISTFFDLIGTRKEEIYGGTHTFNEFASFVLSGTGWTFTSTDVIDSRVIDNFGNDNVIKLVQALCAVYECEYKIMPNNHVVFSKQIGGDYDAQYRYGHNVKALSKTVDTTNLRTRITGYGAEGLVVTYTSPNASVFGIIEADPISDDRFTQADSLLEHLKRSLIDYPEATFELDSVELTEKELGERVWLIYEPMSIEFQTRVLSKKSIIRNDELVTKSVVLGNTLPRTLGDILTSQKVEIDENKKEYRSRFEQTNDRITLEVEAVNESIATIELRADSIELSVSGLDTRLGQAESSISIQAGQISSKVSQTDYNGNTIASLINQSSTTIEIQASKINLVGAVTVLSDISGNLGTITAGNIDLYNEIKVGGGIHMRSSAFKVIRMGEDPVDYGSISVNQGQMQIDAGNSISITAPVNFTHSVTGITATAVLG